MIVLGLTGSIGMGKSTVAAMFAKLGVPVWDADAEVHRLQGPGGRLLAAIEARFPGTTGALGVDRPALGRLVLGDRAELRALEAIIHPAIAESRRAFLRRHAARRLVVLDVPLLFETGGDTRVDASIVVSAPAWKQWARVLARPGMSPARLAATLRHQMRDREKRRRADFVIDTGTTRAATAAQVRALVACMGARESDTAADARDRLRHRNHRPESADGHRLVEIGCVELVNRCETGRTFHAWFNPDRDMPIEAYEVHGLSVAFLSDKPRFTEMVAGLLEFLGDAPLVAHNAGFDFAFLDHELKACARDTLCRTRMIDTLAIARTRHPGAKHTLDALCNRYGIDRSQRIKHGALIDAQLLAQLYVELTGGRQIGLGLDPAKAVVEPESPFVNSPVSGVARIRPPRPHAATADELARHAAFVATLVDPLWTGLVPVADAA